MPTCRPVRAPVIPAAIDAIAPRCSQPWEPASGGGALSVYQQLLGIGTPLGLWDAAHYNGTTGVAADQSGNGRDLTAVSTKPTLNAGGGPNGRDAITFGAASGLKNANIGAGTNPVTVAGIHKVPAASNYAWDGATVLTRALQLFSATPAWRMNAGLSFDTTTGIVAAGSWQVVVTVYNGASSKCSLQGAAIGTGNSGASTDPGIIWGAAGNNTAGLASDAAILVAYTGALSDADINTVSAYLKAWAGL